MVANPRVQRKHRETWGHDRQCGVMADEVETVMGEAERNFGSHPFSFGALAGFWNET